MTQPSDFNARIIEEFRANGGKVQSFARAEMLLLTTTGAKTGQKRATPLVYLPDDGRYVVIASKGGAPVSPAWYFNLKANPAATIEVGTETLEVEAREAQGAERDELFARQAAKLSGFADYQARTTRIIPVMVLTRKQ